MEKQLFYMTLEESWDDGPVIGRQGYIVAVDEDAARAKLEDRFRGDGKTLTIKIQQTDMVLLP